MESPSEWSAIPLFPARRSDGGLLYLASCRHQFTASAVAPSLAVFQFASRAIRSPAIELTKFNFVRDTLNNLLQRPITNFS